MAPIVFSRMLNTVQADATFDAPAANSTGSINAPPPQFTTNAQQNSPNREAIGLIATLAIVLFGLGILSYALFKTSRKRLEERRRAQDDEIAEVKEARTLRPTDGDLALPVQFRSVEWGMTPKPSVSIPLHTWAPPSKQNIIANPYFHPEIQRSRSLADPRPERNQLPRHAFSYTYKQRAQSVQLSYPPFTVGSYLAANPRPLVPFTVTQTRKFPSMELQDLPRPIAPRPFYPKETTMASRTIRAEPPALISRENTTSTKASRVVHSIWSASSLSAPSTRSSATSACLEATTPSKTEFQSLSPPPPPPLQQQLPREELPSVLVFDPNSNSFTSKYRTSNPPPSHQRNTSSIYSTSSLRQTQAGLSTQPESPLLPTFLDLIIEEPNDDMVTQIERWLRESTDTVKAFGGGLNEGEEEQWVDEGVESVTDGFSEWGSRNTVVEKWEYGSTVGRGGIF